MLLKKIGIPKIPSMLISFMTPAIAFYLLESLTHDVTQNMNSSIILLNLVFYYLFFGLLFVVFKCSWISLSLGSFLIMLVGLANYYVIEFRSAPIYPWDLLSIRTAVSVSTNYDYVLEEDARKWILGFLILILIGLWTRWKLPIKKTKGYAILAAVFLIGIGAYTSLVQTPEVHSAVGFYEYLFTPNAFYRKNGFVVSFLSNMQYLEIDEPEGYNPKIIEKVISPYEQTAKGMSESKRDIKQPNVIVIMNEAFSDPSVLGDFETNKEYMPFIKSMKENTIKGYAVSSVKGGNTANAEYEFLTGNSMAYLPMGAIPYQQYMTEPMPNLTSQLKSLGYVTHAMHPYGASGWNRNIVYEYFGFDSMHFRLAFNDAEILRDYVTDLSTYQKIVDLYQAKEEGQPMFVFDVTMQNHSSYSKAYANFTPDVEVYGSTNDELLERYLSLIKVSDAAFEKLVNYFSNQEEPTIILMFGDHQPADWVVQPIYTMNGQTVTSEWSEELERYVVPFVIWSNYDMDTESILEQVNYQDTKLEMLSMNYLSTLLMEAAGLPKSAYQLYMDMLIKKYPIISAEGFYDAQGNFYDTTDLSVIPEELQTYWILNYNRLFDTENCRRNWFE